MKLLVLVAFILLPFTLSYAQEPVVFAGGGTPLEFGHEDETFISKPDRLAVDSEENLYFTSEGRLLFMNKESRMISLLAGGGTESFTEGMDARELEIVDNITITPNDELFINLGTRIVQLDPADYSLTTIAGMGVPGYSGDGGQGIEAAIEAKTLAFGPDNSLYISQNADGFYNVIRKVNLTDGVISSFLDLSVRQIEDVKLMAFDIEENLWLINQAEGFQVSLKKYDFGTGQLHHLKDLHENALTLKSYGQYIHVMERSSFSEILGFHILSMERDHTLRYGQASLACEYGADNETDEDATDFVLLENGTVVSTHNYQNVLVELEPENIFNPRIIGNWRDTMFGDGRNNLESELLHPTRIDINGGLLIFADQNQDFPRTFQGNSVIRGIDLSTNLMDTYAGSGQKIPTDRRPNGACIFVQDSPFALNSDGLLIVHARGLDEYTPAIQYKWVTIDLRTGQKILIDEQGWKDEQGNDISFPLNGTETLTFDRNNDLIFENNGILYKSDIHSKVASPIGSLSDYAHSFEIISIDSDSEGNIFFIDKNSGSIYKVFTDGQLGVIAGDGIPGIPKLNDYIAIAPEHIAIDANNRVLFYDQDRIRRIDDDELTIIRDFVQLTDFDVDADNNIYYSNRASSPIYKIEGETIVSTENGLTSSISVYPNPVSDYLHIRTQDAVFNYEVNDINGRLIMSGRSVKDHSLDISRLPSGLYFLRLVSSGRSDVMRFIKK